MINSVKARTPILALILFLFAVGYTFAANKVVVIPMAGDSVDPAIIEALTDRIIALENAQSISAFSSGPQLGTVSQPTIIRTVSLRAPTNGIIIVNSTVNVIDAHVNQGVECSINSALLPIIDTAHRQSWSSGGLHGGVSLANQGQVAGTRGFNVTAGTNYIFKLVCDHINSTTGATSYKDSSLTAIFTPSA